ncbi:hypothetical protein BDR04DRAFT_1169953 [Suillus decipiens]|nr:hypothetical protein BDR04DRAFT_1169953 [Suillus decipiens]
MNPQSTSSSQLGKTICQDSIISGLQSCLEYPKQVYDEIDCPHEEIVEIYTRITELLVEYQSEITVENEGTMDSGVDFHTLGDDEHQAIMPLVLNDVNTIPPSLAPPEISVLAKSLAFRNQFLDLEHNPLWFTSSLQEDLLLLSETSGFVSNELGVPEFLPRDDTYSKEMLPDSSARHDQPHLAIVQGGQDKVRCTWPGCSRSVKKNNLTRHVNEMHRRRVKAVCVRFNLLEVTESPKIRGSRSLLMRVHQYWKARQSLAGDHPRSIFDVRGTQMANCKLPRQD